jgi:MFS family permease
MTKIRNFLLGCLAGPLNAYVLVCLPISYLNYDAPRDLYLLVGIIGALVGGIIGFFFGEKLLVENLAYPIKCILIAIFIGLLITYVFPHFLCFFYFDPKYEWEHDGCIRFRCSHIRRHMIHFFVPGCALAGLLFSWVKQTKNCKDSIADNK